MNCCDEYGECDQGRDCPVRKRKSDNFVRYNTGWRRLDNVLNAIAYGVSVISAMMLVVFFSWVIWGVLK